MAVSDLMSTYSNAVELLNLGLLDDLNMQEKLDWQNRLSPVLNLFESSAQAYPIEAQDHLYKLGAVLIRLSFLVHCNRHENPQEFSELICNYKVEQNTLHLKLSDLV